MACGKPSPNYDKKVLEGNWLRINSSDARSDSMTINIVYRDSAIVTFVPSNSNFALQQLKWRNITPIAEPGDFQFLDLSADGSYWKAFITMESEVELKIISSEYPDAPGGEQKWVKF
jgi:hypothetical protein